MVAAQEGWPAFPLKNRNRSDYWRAPDMRPEPWPAPIVTRIEPASTWYPAEDYHQDYWDG